MAIWRARWIRWQPRSPCCVLVTPMPTRALRIRFDVAVTSRMYLPQPITMPLVAALSIVLPVMTASASTAIPSPRLSSGSCSQVEPVNEEAAGRQQQGRTAVGGFIGEVMQSVGLIAVAIGDG